MLPFTVFIHTAVLASVKHFILPDTAVYLKHISWTEPLRHFIDYHRHFVCNTSNCVYVWELVCVFAAGFHRDIASWGELADASHPVDRIMVYIYCTNTLSGPLCLSHKAHTDLHGDSWGKENENTLNPEEETMWWDKPPSCADLEVSSLNTTDKNGSINDQNTYCVVDRRNTVIS